MFWEVATLFLVILFSAGSPVYGVSEQCNGFIALQLPTFPSAAVHILDAAIGRWRDVSGGTHAPSVDRPSAKDLVGIDAAGVAYGKDLGVFSAVAGRPSAVSERAAAADGRPPLGFLSLEPLNVFYRLADRLPSALLADAVGSGRILRRIPVHADILRVTCRRDLLVEVLLLREQRIEDFSLRIFFATLSVGVITRPGMSGLVVDGDTGHFALATLVSMAGEETLLALMRNEIRLTDEVLVDWLEYVASISAVPGLVEAVDGAELAPALANGEAFCAFGPTAVFAANNDDARYVSFNLHSEFLDDIEEETASFARRPFMSITWLAVPHSSIVEPSLGLDFVENVIASELERIAALEPGAAVDREGVLSPLASVADYEAVGLTSVAAELRAIRAADAPLPDTFALVSLPFGDALVDLLTTLFRPRGADASDPPRVESDRARQVLLPMDVQRTLALLGQAPQPIATPSGGVIEGSVEVTLSLQPGIEEAASFVEIRYTLDGTAPTAASLLYQAPFALAENEETVLRAITRMDDFLDSDVLVAHYSVVRSTSLALVPIIIVAVLIVVGVAGAVFYFARRGRRFGFSVVLETDMERLRTIGIGGSSVIYLVRCLGTESVAKLFLRLGPTTAAPSIPSAAMSLDNSEPSAGSGERRPSVLTTAAEMDALRLPARHMSVFDRLTSDAIAQARTTLRQSDIAAEFELLVSLNHPNVVRTTRIIRNSVTGLYIGYLMEYMPNGSVYDLLANVAEDIGIKERIRLVLDAARGLQYIHQRGIVHRDIKSLNLLVDQSGVCKVSDFDLSARTDGSPMRPTLGTVPWTAPEVLSGAEHTTASDVYSFGIVLWECASRREPFAKAPAVAPLISMVRSGIRPSPELCDRNTPQAYISLMERCWHGDPAQRPTLSQIVPELLGIWLRTPDPPVASHAREAHFCAKLLDPGSLEILQESFVLGERIRPLQLDHVAVVAVLVDDFEQISRNVNPVHLASSLATLVDQLDLVAKQFGGLPFKQHRGAWLAMTLSSQGSGRSRARVRVGEGSVRYASTLARLALAVRSISGRFPVDNESPMAGQFRLRIGISMGPLLVHFPTIDSVRVVGEAVHLASQMAQMAPLEQVHVTPRLSSLLTEHGFILEERGHVEMRGRGVFPSTVLAGDDRSTLAIGVGAASASRWSHAPLPPVAGDYSSYSDDDSVELRPSRSWA